MARRAAAALALALAACSKTAPPPAPSPTPTRTPVPRPSAPPSPAADAPDLDRARVRLVRIATLDQPLALAVRKDDSTLYVAEKTGRVRAVRDRRVLSRPVLDLSGQVSSGFEQGLLGIAFSPDGRSLYVNYTERDGDTRVVRYRMRGSRADAGSRRQILAVDQPRANHNGGNLAFGPDGYLYVGLGDGGGARDPFDNAQDAGTLLGKMLRVDPEGGSPYRVPRDNPYVGRDGRDEIWASGLRNPWRYSFDRRTGDLWIGDVGQNAREEVNYQGSYSRGGANYGWSLREGTRPLKGDRPRGAVDPVHEYPTRDGCAVTGGYVYRGRRIRHLAGAYVFADFCNGNVTALVRDGRRAREVRRLGIRVDFLASFGEDLAGELYVLSLDGGVFRIAPR